MRSKPLAKLLLVLVGLLALAAPAATAAETLVLTCEICTELVVTGKGLPASEQVRVSVVDVKTGAQVGSQFNVTTDANGAFARDSHGPGRAPGARVDRVEDRRQRARGGRPHRFTAPCKPEDTLSFTGSHTPLLGGLGLALLITGGILVRGSRRAYHPAH